ncbi:MULTISPECIES: response regulator transcription factor [Rhizobium]|uniref:Response regulator transcription factor n=1 Tax=Rhizobium rhododendri TaxID=2506430 RepID=A0ABY8IS19_9HYPH|nr:MULTISPECIES: response regulator transcription factor [Rhizobium]TQX84246.1 response regulator transcription factor [Rhizobium sp. rho-13.1]TQY07805.1 response regulator transcription factor [Rhizobium sp. rho-1.1]WFS26331.1 response regulator transcription factor [Rhizobium rhododendri]
MRVLVVEDDDKTAHYLVRGLSEAGIVIDRAADGELGLALASEDIYDALIVDRLLPKMSGIDLVLALRCQQNPVPILMLSALGNPLDRVEGLRAGCDDYLAKPYAFGELMARLQSIARRHDGAAHGAVLMAGDLTLDIQQRIAMRAGGAISLQFRECLLLQTLMRHANAVVTRSMLLEAAWDYAFEPRGNIIDMHIHRLRRKIDHGHAFDLIRTIPGVGYRLATGPERAQPAGKTAAP